MANRTPEHEFFQNFGCDWAGVLEEGKTAGADGSLAEVARDAGTGVGVVTRVAPLSLRSE